MASPLLSPLPPFTGRRNKKFENNDHTQFSLTVDHATLINYVKSCKIKNKLIIINTSKEPRKMKSACIFGTKSPQVCEVFHNMHFHEFLKTLKTPERRKTSPSIIPEKTILNFSVIFLPSPISTTCIFL